MILTHARTDAVKKSRLAHVAGFRALQWAPGLLEINKRPSHNGDAGLATSFSMMGNKQLVTSDLIMVHDGWQWGILIGKD